MGNGPLPQTRRGSFYLSIGFCRFGGKWYEVGGLRIGFGLRLYAVIRFLFFGRIADGPYHDDYQWNVLTKA